ncbi:MAG: M48 family metallopeptidase [Desulfitobacteriaceae bacterium]
MGQLRIHNEVIDYELGVSSKAKKIIISITRDKVRVSVPRGIPKSKALEFIEIKKDWVFKHWQAYRMADDISSRRYINGAELPYLGKMLVLKIEVYPKKRLGIEYRGSALAIYVPKEVPEKLWPTQVQEAVTAWYKERAREVFWNRLDHYAKLMGVEYKQFRIKEQKTRWGSCSAQGNINLNWRVVLAPEQIVDYLVIHELAHLRHLNHSADFWHLVQSYSPEYKRWRKWLKDRGRDLNI